MLRIFLLIQLGTFFGCVTAEDQTPLTDIDQLGSSDSADVEARIENQSIEGSEDDIWAYDESGEFCKDDIYGSYLRELYFKTHKNKARRYKSRRSRNRYLVRRDVAASHFARIAMSGATPDYFGELPIVINPEVEYWIQYFKTKGRQTFLKWNIRGASIADIVKPILSEHKIPEELFFLAMIESGFNFRAKSRARAMGPWQFMRGTGKLYGLKVSYWVDERNDPVKSTVAAATLLKDLYQRFGDWYLALAAYNAGPGKVRRAIRKTKSRDFWRIARTRYLRAETKHYVPKLLAAIVLSSNPKEHGFNTEPSKIEKFPRSYMTFDRAVKLSEIAKLVGISKYQIRKWNPELIKDIVPPGKNYKLRLPEQQINSLKQRVEELTYLAIKDVKLHKIRPGDTLYGIARKYKVRLRSIKSMNPRLSARRLRPGKSIAIPIPEVVEIKNRRG